MSSYTYLKFVLKDALQAQMVIKKMSEMIGGRTVEEPAENNNQLPTDHQNNIPDVSLKIYKAACTFVEKHVNTTLLSSY